MFLTCYFEKNPIHEGNGKMYILPGIYNSNPNFFLELVRFYLSKPLSTSTHSFFKCKFISQQLQVFEGKLYKNNT